MVAVERSRTVSLRPKHLLPACAVAMAICVMIAGGTWLSGLEPGKRGALPLRNAVPLADEYAFIDRVSHWPMDWVNAVCKPPLYPLRNYKRLPHAISNASCTSQITPAGDLPANIMISRFPSELPMQVDLHNERYEWYAFAYDHGSLVSFATVAEAAMVGTNGLNESVVLEPLKRFGFNIWGSPGPP